MLPRHTHTYRQTYMCVRIHTLNFRFIKLMYPLLGLKESFVCGRFFRRNTLLNHAFLSDMWLSSGNGNLNGR